MSLRKASATVRRQIVEALRDPARRFLDRNTASAKWIDLWNLTAEGFFLDLADGLASDRLFLKPKTFPGQNQRYQCLLRYPADCGFRELDIHITLAPAGEPPLVKVAAHPSDTAQTLPPIFPDPPADESDP
jgi:hypothetical protein